jgi:hypothetical protein
VSTKRRPPTTLAETMADLMAAGAFKPANEIIFNSALFTRAESIRPTADQVLLARINHELGGSGYKRATRDRWLRPSSAAWRSHGRSRRRPIDRRFFNGSTAVLRRMRNFTSIS